MSKTIIDVIRTRRGFAIKIEISDAPNRLIELSRASLTEFRDRIDEVLARPSSGYKFSVVEPRQHPLERIASGR